MLFSGLYTALPDVQDMDFTVLKEDVSLFWFVLSLMQIAAIKQHYGNSFI